MNLLLRFDLPSGCETCPACHSRFWTDGESIRCDCGHLHPPEDWTTAARSFVIEVWNGANKPRESP